MCQRSRARKPVHARSRPETAKGPSTRAHWTHVIVRLCAQTTASDPAWLRYLLHTTVEEGHSPVEGLEHPSDSLP